MRMNTARTNIQPRGRARLFDVVLLIAAVTSPLWFKGDLPRIEREQVGFRLEYSVLGERKEIHIPPRDLAGQARK